MRKLEYEEIRSLSAGALTFEKEEGGLAFYKGTEEQTAAILRDHPALLPAAKAATGVRLDFETDAEELAFTFASGSRLELLLDGILVKTWHGAPRERTGIALSTLAPLKMDGGLHRVTMIFGSHGERTVLSSLEIGEGARLERHRYERKLLFIGDSITQGWHSRFDALSWAWRTSLYFNADSVIQGIGGDRFRPGAILPLPFRPDAVFLALGTNDFTSFDDREEFLGRVRGVLERLGEIYGEKRVFILTPPPRFDGESRPAGDHALFRGLIAEETLKRGFFPVDGEALLPRDESFFADAVHPNDDGFSLYAENLWRILGKSRRLSL